MLAGHDKVVAVDVGPALLNFVEGEVTTPVDAEDAVPAAMEALCVVVVTDAGMSYPTCLAQSYPVAP